VVGRTHLRIRPRTLLLLVSVGLSSLVPLASADAGTPDCLGTPVTHAGTPGPDVLRGTAGGDVFLGGGGDDRLIGRGGDDLFCAGGGNDVVKGGGGNDSMQGQGGDDTLVGGQGDDDLNGGAGTDECTLGETVSNCETPATELEVDGSWSGLTSQAKDISFTVAEHALSTIAIGYAWSGPGCTRDSKTTITYGTPIAIVDNAFDIDGGAGTLSLQIHGEFTSETEATGTFSASDTGGFCPGSASGTWDAARQ